MITSEQREPGGARRVGAEVAGELYRKTEVEEHSHSSKWVAPAMGKNNRVGANSSSVACEWRIVCPRGVVRSTVELIRGR